MPSGRALVLLTEDRRAVWGTSWPHYATHAWAGAWLCSIFRNEGAGLSSELIREAVAVTRWWWRTPEGGMVTFVDEDATRRGRSRHASPGQCFLHAGFSIVGITPTRGRIVLHLPLERMPDALAPAGAQLRLAL